MAAGDLTTKTAVKLWLGLSGTDGDTELDSLVTSVSAWIGQETNRSFGAVTSYSEIRDGTGGTELYLPNAPIVAISSLTVDQVAITAQSADGYPGYFLSGHMLCLYAYEFTRGKKNVRVSYTAGYSSVPTDIAQACIEIVASAYRRGPRGPDLQTQTMTPTGETFTWSMKALPEYVRETLDRYCKVVPA